jgi:hypothetical protein
MKVRFDQVLIGMCFSDNEICYGADDQYLYFVQFKPRFLTYYYTSADIHDYAEGNNETSGDLFSKSDSHKLHIKLLFLERRDEPDDDKFPRLIDYFKTF